MGKIKRSSFVFYESFYDSIEQLDEKIQADVILALVRYALKGEIVPDLKPVANALFLSFKPQIDKNNQRYLNGLNGGEHGVKGGRPKTPKEPQRNPKETPNDNDNVNDSSKRKNNNTTKTDLKERVIIQKKKFFEDSVGSEQDWNDYVKLMGWMKTNTPTVLKMRDVLTAKEFVKLKSNFSSRQIATMLIKMDNYKPLLKKNNSTYRTFINWMERDPGHKPEEMSEATKKLKELMNGKKTK